MRIVCLLNALPLTAVVALLSLPAVGPAATRDVTVTSFDGTRISAHFTPALKRAPSERVPTVLVGPGFPTSGNVEYEGDTSDNIGQLTLRRAGYNVVTWDPRGVGASGGIVTFDSPEFEARDVQALIDFVATQPEALLDAPHDPRVGMSGSSYGGGVQFAVAAIDRRVDAIIPDVTWNSLPASFFPAGIISTGWKVLICGASGSTGGLPANLLGSASAVLARADPRLKSSCVEALGGGLSEANVQWWADRTPAGMHARIDAPTLVTQGTVDTVFPLSEAVANHAVLRETAVPLKMMWHCGGHGRCMTSEGAPNHVRIAGLAWLERWLKRNPAIDTGPPFEWLADDGIWRGGRDYPPAAAGTVNASASDLPRLGISPADSAASGSAFAATPAPNSVTVAFSAPPPNADIVGAPKLSLTYKGTALPAGTYLYAQILDARANRVVGSQATPIPVVLDGHMRTVERELVPIALRAGAGSQYRIQITPGTGLFSAQRSLGGVMLRQVEASLPLVDATRSGSVDARRTPERPLLSASSRLRGGRARIVLRARLRTKPCAGGVTFTIARGKRTTRRDALVARSCEATTVVRLKLRRGTLIGVSARFNGNAELKPRSSRAIRHRVQSRGG